jgi:hypothetical protein
MPVGAAPDLTVDVEEATVVEEAAVAVPELAAAVVEVVVEAEVAFFEPHLSEMLVVQFAWPVALPTLAEIQLSKACWQMY